MNGIPALTFKLLALSLITAKRQLIHNRTASINSWKQSYDFIIVGAGSAGCVVANRLTKSPNIKVLLLEAGGAQSAIYNDIITMADYLKSDSSSQLQWSYYNIPQLNAGKKIPGGRIFAPRAKTIGGSSSHNYRELGFENIDFNGPKQTGVMNMQLFMTSNGFRSSNGNDYIDPNPHPNNLDIVTNALVIKILFEGLTAVGVEFAKDSTPFRVYARKEVILSSGQ